MDATVATGHAYKTVAEAPATAAAHTSVTARS